MKILSDHDNPKDAVCSRCGITEGYIQRARVADIDGEFYCANCCIDYWFLERGRAIDMEIEKTRTNWEIKNIALKAENSLLKKRIKFLEGLNGKK